jgi:hypothetical protein
MDEPIMDLAHLGHLEMLTTEQIVFDDGSEVGIWLSCSNKSYDIAYARDQSGRTGRFHHATYAVDSREDVLRAADVFLDSGVFIETVPHKYAIQQTFFLYVYEPGGNRVEIANAGARPRTGLEADRLERGGAQQGPSVGAGDREVVLCLRDAAAR